MARTQAPAPPLASALLDGGCWVREFAGEYVGEIGLLTGAAHAATAKARTLCQIYRLPNKALAPLLKRTRTWLPPWTKSARRGLGVLLTCLRISD
jgi:CRP-like cAMP-binding protein